MADKGNNVHGPRFAKYMRPVLEALRELGGSGRLSEVTKIVRQKIDVPEDQIHATTKCGQSRFTNDVSWARYYLLKAGYLGDSERGIWRLTEKGQATHLDDDEAWAIYRSVASQSVRNRRTRAADEREADGREADGREADPKAYWRGTFSSRAWDECRNGGGLMLSLSPECFANASHIEPGDIILCCIFGLDIWVGILQVIGDDDIGPRHRGYHPTSLPLSVAPLLILDITDGLHMGDNATGDPPESDPARLPDHWDTEQGSWLSEYKREDGELLVKAIQVAHASVADRMGLATRSQHRSQSGEGPSREARVDASEVESSIKEVLPSSALGPQQRARHLANAPPGQEPSDSVVPDKLSREADELRQRTHLPDLPDDDPSVLPESVGEDATYEDEETEDGERDRLLGVMAGDDVTKPRSALDGGHEMPAPKGRGHFADILRDLQSEFDGRPGVAAEVGYGGLSLMLDVQSGIVNINVRHLALRESLSVKAMLPMSEKSIGPLLAMYSDNELIGSLCLDRYPGAKHYLIRTSVDLRRYSLDEVTALVDQIASEAAAALSVIRETND